MFNFDNKSSSVLFEQRRRWLKAGVFGALTLTTSGWSVLAKASRAEAAAGGKTVRVGHMPAGCVSHLLLAKQRGLFEKAGLHVLPHQFNAPSEALQALLSDNITLMHGPWTMSVAAFADGTDELRIVGGSGQAGIELVARDGSVTSVDEFREAAGKGLRVGTLRLDTLELVAYGHIAQAGASYDDYEMTFFPSMVGMGEAIANGSLDVCTLAQPYAEQVVQQAGARYLSDSTAIWGPEAADCVVTTHVDRIDNDADTLAAYLAVLKQSADLLNSDYENALDDLVPLFGVPKDILRVALKRQYPHPTLSEVGINGLKTGNRYLVDLGYLQDDVIDSLLYLDLQPA